MGGSGGSPATSASGRRELAEILGVPDRRKKGSPERITDPEVVTCVEGVFLSLTFPPTMRGLVNLVYPVVLHTE